MSTSREKVAKKQYHRERRCIAHLKRAHLLKFKNWQKFTVGNYLFEAQSCGWNVEYVGALFLSPVHRRFKTLVEALEATDLDIVALAVVKEVCKLG